MSSTRCSVWALEVKASAGRRANDSSSALKLPNRGISSLLWESITVGSGQSGQRNGAVRFNHPTVLDEFRSMDLFLSRSQIAQIGLFICVICGWALASCVFDTRL